MGCCSSTHTSLRWWLTVITGSGHREPQRGTSSCYGSTCNAASACQRPCPTASPNQHFASSTDICEPTGDHASYQSTHCPANPHCHCAVRTCFTTRKDNTVATHHQLECPSGRLSALYLKLAITLTMPHTLQASHHAAQTCAEGMAGRGSRCPSGHSTTTTSPTGMPGWWAHA